MGVERERERDQIVDFFDLAGGSMARVCAHSHTRPEPERSEGPSRFLHHYMVHNMVQELYHTGTAPYHGA
jgi:hypothetical protein